MIVINMNKKRILLFVAFALCSVLSVMAQGERIFLFDHFAEGVIKFNTGAVNASLMNYDANNGKMYFMQGETMMELTVPEEIDSIRFGERKFVGRKGDFVERCKLKHGTVDILWRIHKVHEGYVGAFGQTQQVGAKKIELQGNFGMGGFANGGMYNGSSDYNRDSNGRNLDVWKMKNANTYYFEKDGKQYAISRLKSLYKKFPKQKAQLEAFASEHGLDFMSADKAVTLIDYLLSL